MAKLSSMYTYLLFDCDNTLLDFDQGELLAFQALCQDFGIDAGSYPLYHTLNQQCWKELEQGKLDQQELRAERFRRFLPLVGCAVSPQAASDRFLQELSRQGIPYPQTKPLLTELRKRGYVLYLASNGIAFVQRGRYQACDLLSYLDGAFVSEDLGFQKPDRRFFDEMLRRIGSPDRKSCLMIGDSLSSDIAGGNAAGIDTVWLNQEGETIPKVQRPTYVIKNLTEVLALLPPRSQSQ